MVEHIQESQQFLKNIGFDTAKFCVPFRNLHRFILFVKLYTVLSQFTTTEYVYFAMVDNAYLAEHHAILVSIAFTSSVMK